ncbi:MAG: hypothetical protein AAFV07_05285 [Bacteroidota bacterium]
MTSFTRFGLLGLIGLSLLSGCIGTDILQDLVSANVRITNPVDTLGVGDTYSFEARYVNDIGRETAAEFRWLSTDPEKLTIDANGLATGVTTGDVAVVVEVMEDDAALLHDTLPLVVGASTVVSSSARMGSIQTTSSYALEGDFTLEEQENGDLVLSFGDDYEASSALPGLYVYLGNNPNSISDAFEISEVTVFEGKHTYTIKNVELGDYDYLLYWCKPFGVKVGDGTIGQ